MTDNAEKILAGIFNTRAEIKEAGANFEHVGVAQMYNGDAYLNDKGLTNAEEIFGDAASEYTVTD